MPPPACFAPRMPPPTMPKLCVISPGMADGGANLLMGRAALHLSRKHAYMLHLVDVQGGAVWRLWKKEGVEFTFQAYERGQDMEVAEGDAVLLSLLSAKLIGGRFRIRPTTKLILWCTAPQDPFKFLPWSLLANSWSWRSRGVVSSVLSPSHKGRIAAFLRDASARGGVHFMDQHNFEVNQLIFGRGIVPAVLPICTAAPMHPPRQGQPEKKSAYWVGRVADFKTQAFIASARAIIAHGCAEEVVVIGDGADVGKAREELRGLPVRWLGAMGVGQLEQEIYANAWFVFGHATSLLEAAKFGIPSLLVDGTYDKVSPASLKTEWLHRCPDGYVCSIVRSDEMIGRPVAECLAELASNYELLAKASFARWQRDHSPDIAADNLHRAALNCKYCVGDFLSSGANHPGPLGGIMEFVKRRVFGRNY